MQITASITYTPATLADFTAAIDYVRTLAPAIASAVTVRPPAPVAKGAKGPNEQAYLAARGETVFRRTTAERDSGLSSDAAAAARMQVPGWESGVSPAPAASEPDALPDSTAEPHDGSPLF